MIQLVDQKVEREKVLESRNYIVKGFVEFSDKWLVDYSLKLVAAENSAHPYGPELLSLIDAFKVVDRPDLKFFAVTCDPDVSDSESVVYQTQITQDDFEELIDIFIAYNFLLFSSDLKHAVLFVKTLDFKYLAGSVDFLVTYGGELLRQRDHFKEFVDNQFRVNAFSPAYLNNLMIAYGKMDYLS
jgi:hypothetical protein